VAAPGRRCASGLAASRFIGCSVRGGPRPRPSSRSRHPMTRAEQRLLGGRHPGRHPMCRSRCWPWKITLRWPTRSARALRDAGFACLACPGPVSIPGRTTQRGRPRRRGPLAGVCLADAAWSGHAGYRGGRSAWERLEKLTLTRGPAGVACLGSQRSQSRCARPPITIRSLLAGVKPTLRPPDRGLIRNRRGAPRLRTRDDALGSFCRSASRRASRCCRGGRGRS
jgi:hypothetical protein